jgi:hypothetical protein
MLRRIVQLAVAVLGLLILQQAAANAADFTVNSDLDTADAAPGNGICATADGVCTLRAAVAETEATAAMDTIRIPAMSITLGSSIQFSKSTVVIGAGARSTIITGSPGVVLFRVTGLQQEFRGMSFQGASTNSFGALAVYQNANAVTTLNRVRVTQNTTTAGGAAYPPVTATAGELIVQDSEISNNSVASTSGQVLGGGIHVSGASTKLTVINSTIANNTAQASDSSAFGGGIFGNQASVDVRHTTVAGNAARNTKSVSALGGNIYSTGPTTIRDSIIANGVAQFSNSNNCWGSTFTFAGRNIASDSTCPASATMQITDPQLSAMADNGGPTNTMIPALNSPAVNAVTPCTSSSDQRGQQRPIGPGCDIGAVEIGADIRSAQSISNPAPSPGSDVVITATFSNAGMDDAPSTTGTITVPKASAVLSTTVTQGTCSIAGTTVNCGLGTLKRSQPATVIAVIRAPSAGDVTSTASVSSPLTDAAPGNNTSSVTASVKGGTPQPAPQPQPTACSNVISGTPKNDRLKGTPNGDTIRGRAAADRVKGLAGNDCLFGDGGADRIVGGAGSDRISGGAGNDVIRAKDGTRDVIRCGAGRDTVVADRSDKVRKDCERVRRR